MWELLEDFPIRSSSRFEVLNARLAGRMVKNARFLLAIVVNGMAIVIVEGKRDVKVFQLGKESSMTQTQRFGIYLLLSHQPSIHK